MEPAIVGGLVALIVAICQFLKVNFLASARYVPLIAIGLGIVLAFLVSGIAWVEIATGVVLGLSASGIFSATKSVVFNQ